MRASRLASSAFTALFGVSAFGCTTGGPNGEFDELATRSAAVLLADEDGDGVADDLDNCPSLGNADQARAAAFGPGDACRLALHTSGGLLGRFARFRSHKELATSLTPFRVNFGPDLLRVGASGQGFAVASFAPFSQRLGVWSQGDPNVFGSDTLRPGETLALEVGSAHVLGAASASAVWLRLEGEAQLRITLSRAGAMVHSELRGLHGSTFARFAAADGSSFDRVVIGLDSGSAALRGPGEIAVFALGEAQLHCGPGEELVNGACRDIDECAGLNHTCDPLSTCTNTPGGFSCGPCPSGYGGSGSTACIDVDECAEGSATCSTLVACSNTAGGYACGACPSGYRGDGHSCADVDECAEGSAHCDARTTCTNTPGGYACGDCPTGYRGDGASGCVDVDECALATPVCDALSQCTNTDGAYSCAPCPAGYRGTGDTSCVDVDECADGTAACSTLVTCQNTAGGYECGACPPGYAGDGHSCADIDECATGSHDCSALTTCTNSEGGYLCGACPIGYVGDGHSCTDIDECAAAPCDAHVSCTNTAGSYLCSACPPGYTGDGYVGCVDVDECSTDNGGCASTDGCANAPGSFSCVACPGTPGVPTSCGVGACARSGVTTCTFGVLGDSCSPAVPSANTDTSCNGIDDDCDGSIDEDYVPTATSCGAGGCAGSGTRTCVAGVELDSCAPLAAGTVCDDGNHCNGRDYCNATGSCVSFAPSAAMCCPSGVALDSLAGTGVELETASNFASAVQPLYSGAYASQLNAVAGAFSPTSVAVVHGRVLDPNGAVLSCATANIPVIPGVGSTLSRPDGTFSLVVNGGTWNVRFSAPGFTAVTVQVKAKENRVLEVGDVRLRP